jgi:YD repeat-containing protein
MSSNEPIYEYDSNGNEIHYKDNDGYEWWCEYDSNGKLIHFKTSDGVEYWHEYDANGNYIHFKNSDGFEEWFWEGKLTEDPIKILLLNSQLCSKVPQ